MQYDCIILGGGIVGLTLASLLSEHLERIAVIDPNLNVTLSPSNYDLRVSAITRSSEKILKKAKAWPSITRHRYTPYEHMTVWDEIEAGEISFHAADIHQPNLGYIIENSVIRYSLLSALKRSETVHLMNHSKALSLTRETEGLSLEIFNEETDKKQFLQGKLVVGADGGRSWLRGILNIPSTSWDYNHHAVVAHIKTQYAHEQTAWQRFIQTGPVAVLPLSEPNHASIVWSTSPERAERCLQQSKKEFEAQLAAALDYRLGQVTLVSERFRFPLRMQHAKRYIDERSVLVGDAAHTIHPLAGQGVNLGLLDVAALSEVIIDAKQKDYDIGQESVLRRYERWRRGQNMKMIALMEGFKQLFGVKNPTVATLRSLGLEVTHRTSWVKRLIMKQAMGIEGNLPKVAVDTI